jgi:hypothetical protein
LRGAGWDVWLPCGWHTQGLGWLGVCVWGWWLTVGAWGPVLPGHGGRGGFLPPPFHNVPILPLTCTRPGNPGRAWQGLMWMPQHRGCGKRTRPPRWRALVDTRTCWPAASGYGHSRVYGPQLPPLLTARPDAACGAPCAAHPPNHRAANCSRGCSELDVVSGVVVIVVVAVVAVESALTMLLLVAHLGHAPGAAGHSPGP